MIGELAICEECASLLAREKEYSFSDLKTFKLHPRCREIIEKTHFDQGWGRRKLLENAGLLKH